MGRKGWLIMLLVVGGLMATACSSGKATAGTGGRSRNCPNGVTVGFFGALTGKVLPEIGIGEANATRLAIEQYNRTHPKCRVSFQGFDSQGDAAQAPGLAQQVVSDKNIVALIGPAYSGESQVADPIFDRADLPIVTVSATFAQLGHYGWRVFHRAVANDAAQAPAIARYVVDTLKAKSVAVIEEDSDYGRALGDAVRRDLSAAGVTAVSLGSIDNSHSYPVAVNAVRAARVEAVFYAGYFWESGPLAKQLKDAGANVTFLSGDGSLDAAFVTGATPAGAEGAVLTAPMVYVLTSPDTQGFVTMYKARFSTLPVIYTAEAYDAANHVLAAIASGNYTRPQINRYLGSTPYKGLLKTYAYGPDGELTGPAPIFVHKVINGQIRLVGRA